MIDHQVALLRNKSGISGMKLTATDAVEKTMAKSIIAPLLLMHSAGSMSVKR